jgi:hypothetical protein
MQPIGANDKLAHLTALVGLGFAWSQSPYWHAWPSDLSYRCERSNVLPAESEPGSGKLSLAIYNASERPAQHVDVLVHPVTPAPKVSSDTLHSEHPAPDGRILVRLERVPAKSWAIVEVVDESIVALPSRKGRFGASPRHRYAPEVIFVRTAFGDVQAEAGKSRDRISYLTGDSPRL